MKIKMLFAFIICPLLLSACSLMSTDNDEVATVSTTPKLSKAAMKPATVDAETKAASCDDKGFCALPGLKKPKAAE